MLMDMMRMEQAQVSCSMVRTVGSEGGDKEGSLLEQEGSSPIVSGGRMFILVVGDLCREVDVDEEAAVGWVQEVLPAGSVFCVGRRVVQSGDDGLGGVLSREDLGKLGVDAYVQWGIVVANPNVIGKGLWQQVGVAVRAQLRLLPERELVVPGMEVEMFTAVLRWDVFSGGQQLGSVAEVRKVLEANSCSKGLDGPAGLVVHDEGR